MFGRTTLVAQSDAAEPNDERRELRGLNLARILVNQRRWDDALAVLQTLIGDPDSDQTEVMFLRALALIEVGRAAEAADILRTILESRPDLTRVRLELGRALFVAKEDDAARRHFELVLATDQPPAVVANVGLFLDRIRARRGWKTWLNFGVAPDTNFNSGSYNERIYCGSFLGCNENREGERSGVGLFVLAGFEAKKAAGKNRLMILETTTTRWEYKGGEVDTHIVRAEAKMRGLRAGGYVEVGPVAQWRWSENDFYSKEFGLRVSNTQRVGPRASLFSRWESIYRQFQENPDRNDGLRHALSFSVNYAIDAVTYAQGGLGVDYSTAKAVNNGSFSPGVNAGVRREFGAGFTLGLYLNASRTLWHDNFNFFNYRRKDNYRAATLTALKRDWRLYGFAPEFSLTWSETRSNIDVFANRRLRAGFNFTRDF